MIDTNTFPDEVKEALAPYMDGPQDNDALANIGLVIVERRTEAIAARAEIERIWVEAEEAYIGIDDQNRHEFGAQRWSKSPSMDGPVTTDRKPGKKNVQATAFVRLTARYVDAGAGKLIEILLPPDDKPFSFREMPVPDLIAAKDDNSPVVHDGLGNGQSVPLFRAAKPGEAPPAQAPAPQPAPPLAPQAAAQPPSPAAAAPAPATAPAAGAVPAAGAAGQPPAGQVPLTVKDFANENIERARASAKKAEDRVYNWMIECGRTAEVRKQIFDAARMGVGVIKGPIPITKRGMMVRKEGDKDLEILIQNKVIPATKWVDPWNFYPDPACGEDIHDGDYCLEKDHLSERQVRKLKGEPGYIDAQLEKVLEEGPEKINVEGQGGENARPGQPKKRKRFPVWYYYGTLKREEYLAVQTGANGAKGVKTKEEREKGLKDGQELVYCIATLINDTVVRAVINPLESGDFPYHAFPWQRRTGSWAGIGVGEQMRVPQRMINAATRAMLNNAGKSAGSQIVLNRACVTPGNGDWTMTPDKIWFLNVDAAAVSDVRQAFMIFDIPNVTDKMLEITKYAMMLAEESTSIPLITQGQTGDTTPDTLGATQLQNNNANQLLRTIGYTYDDYVTEKEVRQYYEWLLLDPDVPDEEKGEFEIDAHGSVALVERAIQNQTIGQMATVVLNPAYGFDPKRWGTQYVKINRLDPKDFQYSEEEQQRMDANPVKPVQVQVAEANNASREKIASGQQGIEGQKVQNEHTQAAGELTVRLHEAQTEIEALKTRLAETSMKLNTQQQLNAQDIAAELHKHYNPAPQPAVATLPGNGKPQKPNAKNALKPPVQVPGKAGNGKAFTQAP